MNKEQKQVYAEKLRLLLNRALGAQAENVKRIEQEQNAKGMLKSGNTIKRIMESVYALNSKLYSDALETAKSCTMSYSPKAKDYIYSEATKMQEGFLNPITETFKQQCQSLGRNGLYELIRKDFEKALSANLAEFRNELHSFDVELKSKRAILEKPAVLWWIEAILLLASAGIATMWHFDPNGNYEPILVLAALILPILIIARKIRNINT